MLSFLFEELSSGVADPGTSSLNSICTQRCKSDLRKRYDSLHRATSKSRVNII